MGRYGYGYGYAPCRTPAVIWSADFSALPLSTTANASELRAALAAMGLTLTRASAATVQTSASEVVTSGIGVDDPRVGRYGLVIEEARTNLVKKARVFELDASGFSLPATNATTVANGFAGPDGSMVADRTTVTVANGFSAYQSATILGSTKYAHSIWVRSPSGSSAYQSFTNLGTTPAAVSGTADTTWRRVSATATASGLAATTVPTSGQAAAGANATPDQVIDLCQLEQGAFPTEAILTTGAAATRATDLLVANDPARMIRSGRLGMECRFVPKGNSADHTGSPYVWWSDAGNNYAYWNATLGKFLVIIGGATAITSGAFSWSAGDVVDLWIEAGGGTSTIKARTNSGATQNLGTDATVRAAITGANLSLMGRGGAVLTSWMQRARAYAPGRRPAWAA